SLAVLLAFAMKGFGNPAVASLSISGLERRASAVTNRALGVLSPSRGAKTDAYEETKRGVVESFSKMLDWVVGSAQYKTKRNEYFRLAAAYGEAANNLK
ncbi:hypothetical protein PMAYCL1PPCAC_27052, partial [Pristionchus mayeri]